jgi:PIN domain nuclease of toxin-antitoxin system
VKLLLDTHVALWAIADSARLSRRAREFIRDADFIHVSVVSLWEIAVKRSRRPQSMPVTSADARRHFEDAGYLLVPVLASHAIAIDSLARHHTDPFDRMIVVQAMIEPFRLLTHDRALGQYSDTVIVI